MQGINKRLVVLVALTFIAIGRTAAQEKGAPSSLQHREDSLKIFADQMINSLDGKDRYNACMQFIPHLVKALETPHSFRYPFDSLTEVSIVYPGDSAFRIFTWAITTNNSLTYRFYGALQMHTPDGSLKLFPFFDNSEFTHDLDTITSNKAWIGALYYHVVATRNKGRTYYTLFGWHGYDFRSNEKILEVLTFEDHKPVFGAPVFNFKKDSIPGGIHNRFLLIYKRDGNASMNYDPEEKMIIFDHLVSLNGKPEEKYTLVPDGTYEGFSWKNGFWMHVPKVFNTISAKPPFPEPVQFKKNILDKELNKKGKNQ